MRASWTFCLAAAVLVLSARLAPAAEWVAKFPLSKSGLELSRPAQAGAFFDVVGRRSGAFGYENRSLEAWAYPLKLVHDFKLAFRVVGYPLEIEGGDTLERISVRPEATVFTYSHAAFTVRQIVYAPLDEPGIVMLLDVESTLPMTVVGSFRPRLRLMWPAGLMTGDLGWDEKDRIYTITEESKRFAAVIGAPGARDLAVMPYQEEPRDVPIRFELDVPLERMATHFVPIVLVGGVEGRDKAKADYARLLAAARPLYEKNVEHYRGLAARTLQVETPDERVDSAFAWAKVGIDKGVVVNPLLGTGLLAGYRTSGESERPGFAWMFGRDALWSALAVHSYGDFAVARTALDFLRKYQRADGKVPHEISQSASLIPWFTDYPFPWNSADATPLYVIAHADHFRHTGDLAFLRASWESIVKAWRFTAATDTDGNGLVENTKFGHGWVEGGALYPPHEEIYMQGAWIEACRGLAELAAVMNEPGLAQEALAWAERTRAATEKVYWLPDRNHYGYATKLPDEKRREAEPGPRRAERQARMDAMKDARFYAEDTVLPAVPLWWRTLDPERAQGQVDRLGAGALATDWGHRLLSNQSELYDPLSYHYGSVWPLFTGWASVAAYRHGRPHVGWQAFIANALLTFQDALGYVTELLSGDFNAAFGRSSHHQVWSEAMVVSPLVRGTLGLEGASGGRDLTFAPQLPADWDRVAARNVAVGDGRWDLELQRSETETSVAITRRAGSAPLRLTVAPAFPLDATVRAAALGGRPVPFKMTRVGDVQRAEVVLDDAPAASRLVFTHDAGTDVFVEIREPLPGATSQGLRVLRSRAEGGALRLLLEGLAGRAYSLGLRSGRTPERASGATLARAADGRPRLEVAFEGAAGRYVRREVTVTLR